MHTDGLALVSRIDEQRDFAVDGDQGASDRLDVGAAARPDVVGEAREHFRQRLHREDSRSRTAKARCEQRVAADARPDVEKDEFAFQAFGQQGALRRVEILRREGEPLLRDVFLRVEPHRSAERNDVERPRSEHAQCETPEEERRALAEPARRAASRRAKRQRA